MVSPLGSSRGPAHHIEAGLWAANYWTVEVGDWQKTRWSSASQYGEAVVQMDGRERMCRPRSREQVRVREQSSQVGVCPKTPDTTAQQPSSSSQRHQVVRS